MEQKRKNTNGLKKRSKAGPSGDENGFIASITVGTNPGPGQTQRQLLLEASSAASATTPSVRTAGVQADTVRFVPLR